MLRKIRSRLIVCSWLQMMINYHIDRKDPKSAFFFILTCEKESLGTAIPLYFSMSPSLVAIETFDPRWRVLYHDAVSNLRLFQSLLLYLIHLLLILSNHWLSNRLKLLGWDDRRLLPIMKALVNHIWKIWSRPTMIPLFVQRRLFRRHRSFECLTVRWWLHLISLCLLSINILDRVIVPSFS